MNNIVITKPGDYTIDVRNDSKIMLYIVQVNNQSKPINCQVNLIEDGAETEIVGGFWQQGDDQSQLNIVIHHQARNTKANFMMKGVLDGKSKARFNGLIKIDQNAQQVESFLEHRTLLLSEDATVEPIPSLKIKANDVKASHAATVSGLLDDDLFYLQTRGINKKQTTKMLVKSFLSPVLDLLPVEPKKALLAKL